MPTDRFVRLPEEKKAAIRDAALEEFARVSLDKASINKIIKRAGISRGSFYTYFRDKQDILNFIFADVHERSNEFINDILTENGGDFFDAWDKLLDFCLLIFEDRGFMALVQRSIDYLGVSQIIFGSDESRERERCHDIEHLMTLIDMSGMRISTVEELDLLVGLSLSNLAMVLIEFYQGKQSIESLRNKYEMGQEIIKRGVLSA